jgi:hypothetical protein
MKQLAVIFFVFLAQTLRAQSIDLNTLRSNDTLSISKGAKITFSKTTTPLPNLICLDSPADPTAMFVAGFGINANVSVLPMAPGGGGVLPADLPVAPMSVENIGKAAVPPGYVISFKLYAMTFLAVVGGQAGYSKGGLVASASMMGPALAPGAKASMSKPTAGAGSFTPQLPNPLPCGLYELVITIDTADLVVESNKNDNVCISYIYAPGVGQPFTFSWNLTSNPGAVCPPATPGAVQVIAQAAAAGTLATGSAIPPGWCPGIEAIPGGLNCPPGSTITNYLPPPIAWRDAGAAKCWVQCVVTPPAGINSYNVNGAAMANFPNSCDQPTIGDNKNVANAGGLPPSSKLPDNKVAAPTVVVVDCNVGGNDCSITTFPHQDCIFTTSVTWRVTAISNDGCVISESEYTQDVTHRGN